MPAKIARNSSNYRTIRFLHNTARLRTTRVTRQKLLDFGWEVLTSPPHRPDLAPKDYLLFLALSNALQGKASEDLRTLGSLVEQFSVSVPIQFYAGDIETLPEIGKQ
ncbi:hypothetical protein Y032_0164g3521 [Ancylostoma ceylanicum]|uniref:Tc1-like transposase DDE domain-containing protein n=1 Tax=Ancylostoma ceylanicum TaxID=53326 RepID=A0A016SXG2_9BILA|nr:hypothetical protein Y032_0164g3521 [Ancylostoma ceylanicum]